MTSPPRRAPGSSAPEGAAAPAAPGEIRQLGAHAGVAAEPSIAREPSIAGEPSVAAESGDDGRGAVTLPPAAEGDAMDELVAALGARPKPFVPRAGEVRPMAPVSPRKQEPTVLIAPPTFGVRLVRWTGAGLALAAGMMGAALLLRAEPPADGSASRAASTPPNLAPGSAEGAPPSTPAPPAQAASPAPGFAAAAPLASASAPLPAPSGGSTRPGAAVPRDGKAAPRRPRALERGTTVDPELPPGAPQEASSSAAPASSAPPAVPGLDDLKTHL